MKRNKHCKVKKEVPESSASHSRSQEEHDLAYYIHDRVELMHQVFSALKYKEIKAMAPACIRNISIDDLQELCTEELLGISSKRLCAILDGAEPPSDTESSSQSPTEQLETISLDSISSDEEILSQEEKSKKKKHKHRHRDSKSKHKRSHDEEQTTEKSKASRAGLTVLELLELQARARAIRAQLQQEQTKPVSDLVAAELAQSTHSQSSEDEVEIKEEPAEVVEISSDEEKPKIEDLEINKPQQKPTEPQSNTITKHVNDLVITVPKQKTQKIKLNRTKSVPQDVTVNVTNKVTTTDRQTTDIAKDKEANKVISKDIDETKDNSSKGKDKSKKKKKKRPSNASDNDEITLQLSDTEKMDLLEDLDRKNYDNVSSDTCSDSDSDEEVNKSKKEIKDKKAKKDKTSDETDKAKTEDKDITTDTEIARDDKNTDEIEIARDDKNTDETEIARDHKSTNETEIEEPPKQDEISANLNMKDDIAVKETESNEIESSTSDICKENDNSSKQIAENDEIIKENEKTDLKSKEDIVKKTRPEVLSKDLSEGELSDRESSEVEAVDLKPEVVCISDEEDNKSKKKKKKKFKKCKKDKKSKKKDFRESGDQNFYNITDSNITNLISKEDNNTQSLNQEENKEDTEEKKLTETVEIDLMTPEKCQQPSVTEVKQKQEGNIEEKLIEEKEESRHEIVEISDEVYELSDDSSIHEYMESTNVLSKEPTTLEIEALSAKIDEIERIEVITEEEIREYESRTEEEVAVSWKDRYLDSKKVKRVLDTSNILNALRKKNIELKRKLEESKIETQEIIEDVPVEIEKEDNIAEGSIDQYNTLQGSTKFVDPIKEVPINDTLKKDAEQLLKMYKKLLKYNDMSRKRDPNKKKKKKKSKKEKIVEKVDEKITEGINKM